MRVHITSLTSPLLLNSRTNPRQLAAMYMCWFWLRFYILSIRIWNCSDCVIFLHFFYFPLFLFFVFCCCLYFILFFIIIFTYIVLTIATQIYLSNRYMYIWELSVADNRSNNNGSAVICSVFLIVCLLLIFFSSYYYISIPRVHTLIK
jgi:hypothetical protein